MKDQNLVRQHDGFVMDDVFSNTLENNTALRVHEDNTKFLKIFLDKCLKEDICQFSNPRSNSSKNSFCRQTLNFIRKYKYKRISNKEELKFKDLEWRTESSVSSEGI